MSWKTYPIERRRSSTSRSRTSTPSTSMRPALGSMRRLIILSVVVLPQPEAPRSTSVSPPPTSRLTSRTAHAAPPSNDLDRSESSITRARPPWVAMGAANRWVVR